MSSQVKSSQTFPRREEHDYTHSHGTGKIVCPGSPVSGVFFLVRLSCGRLSLPDSGQVFPGARVESPKGFSKRLFSAVPGAVLPLPCSSFLSALNRRNEENDEEYVEFAEIRTVQERGGRTGTTRRARACQASHIMRVERAHRLIAIRSSRSTVKVVLSSPSFIKHNLSPRPRHTHG